MFGSLKEKVERVTALDDARRLPRIFEDTFSARVGFNPMRHARKIDDLWSTWITIGFCGVFFGAGLLLAAVGVTTGHIPVESGRPLVIVLGSMGLVCLLFGTLLAHTPNLGVVPEIHKSRMGSMTHFLDQVIQFQAWTTFESGVTPFPSETDAVKAIATHILVEAAKKQKLYERDNKEDAEYLGTCANLQREFAARHSVMVLLGVAVPAWDTYYEKAREAIANK